MRHIRNDGGRAEAGRRGSTGDCVTRAIAIASGRPYDEVYQALAAGNAGQRKTTRSRTTSGRRSASNGIHVTRQWFKDYMRGLGFVWTPTMQIGSGCTVHLTDGELPMGRLVVSLSRHYCAVIDGVIHDLYDPQRDGEEWYGPFDPALGRNPVIRRTGGRCVYGYWRLA